MSQLLFSICRNPKPINSNASKGMDSLVRQEQAHKEQKLPSSMSFYWLPVDQQKVWPRREVGFPSSEGLD